MTSIKSWIRLLQAEPQPRRGDPQHLCLGGLVLGSPKLDPVLRCGLTSADRGRIINTKPLHSIPGRVSSLPLVWRFYILFFFPPEGT